MAPLLDQTLCRVLGTGTELRIKAKRWIAVRPRKWEGSAMSDDRCTVTIPADAYSAMIDAVQCAVIDKGASAATRRAGFSALLALVDAGLITDGSASSSATDRNGPASAQARTGLRLTG